MAECTLPPRGWYCARLAHHEGDCDASPEKPRAERVIPTEYAIMRAAMIIMSPHCPSQSQSWDTATIILWEKAVDKAKQILSPYVNSSSPGLTDAYERLNNWLDEHYYPGARDDLRHVAESRPF